MEHLPASDEDAITASLDLVDEADIYLGVFAFRYGHVPQGYDRSITEMEYERAVERGIQRICFVMADDHRVVPGDAETRLRQGDPIQARELLDQVWDPAESEAPTGSSTPMR